MDTAPKDGTSVLLCVEGKAIEGYFDESQAEWGVREWVVVTLLSHGCGCCGFNNEEPKGWLPLPNTP